MKLTNEVARVLPLAAPLESRTKDAGKGEDQRGVRHRASYSLRATALQTGIVS
jgi:hypothetical protein